MALEAQLAVTGPTGNKTVGIENFFISPKKTAGKENILMPGEIVTEIRIPPSGGGMKSLYRKIAARKSWDSALASVAAVLRIENDTVSAARIVLGGVGPYPWRIEAAEKLLVGKKLDAATAAAAADAAVTGAFALRDNAYKLEMVKGAVEESLTAFS